MLKLRTCALKAAALCASSFFLASLESSGGVGPAHFVSAEHRLDHAKKTFEKAQFKCRKPNTKSGLSCRGYLDSYSEPVTVIIPVRAALGEVQKSAKLILHLHGHLGWIKKENRAATYDDVLADTNFSALLADSKRSDVLVVPASLGKCETFKDEFSEASNFLKFLGELVALLKDAEITTTLNLEPLTLTGHSGAYAPIAKILEHSPKIVSEVALFDSLYGATTYFADFLLENRSARFVSYFISDSPTSPGNFALWKQLDPFRKDSDIDEFYKSCYDSNSLEKAKKQRIAFVLSSSDHLGTLNTFFSDALRTK